MINWLKSLWGYECMVHRQCIEDLTTFLNISARNLAYSLSVLLLGIIALFLLSGPNAAFDQLIYSCFGIIGAFLLVYCFYRMLAPVKLMERELSLRRKLEGEKAALEEKLQPKLEIEHNENDPAYFHESPYFRSDTPLPDVLRSHGEELTDWRLCRIAVRNLSKSYTIRNVEVKLLHIEQCPAGLKGKLPLHLHFMHDNNSPFKHSIDINPGSRQFVDVITWSWEIPASGPPEFTINHSEVGLAANIPVDKYKLTIEVSANDAIAISKDFRVGMRNKDGSGNVIWMWPV